MHELTKSMLYYLTLLEQDNAIGFGFDLEQMIPLAPRYGFNILHFQAQYLK